MEAEEEVCGRRAECGRLAQHVPTKASGSDPAPMKTQSFPFHRGVCYLCLLSPPTGIPASRLRILPSQQVLRPDFQAFTAGWHNLWGRLEIKTAGSPGRTVSPSSARVSCFGAEWAGWAAAHRRCSLLLYSSSYIHFSFLNPGRGRRNSKGGWTEMDKGCRLPTCHLRIGRYILPPFSL